MVDAPLMEPCPPSVEHVHDIGYTTVVGDIIRGRVAINVEVVTGDVAERVGNEYQSESQFKLHRK